MQNVGLWAMGFQIGSPSTPDNGSIYLWGALAIGVLGLVVAFLFSRSVLSSDAGTVEMQAISNAIREGAEAFMSRQYGTIAIIAVVLAALLFIGYRLSPFTAPFANKVVISFLIGAICSGLSGFTGMFVSIRTNIRAASAARTSMGRALQTALRGGAVTGLVVVALSLLGIGVLFFLFGGLDHPQATPYELVGFGFGASLVALFAQLGGGIYTKAADVGADLVGKVEAGIPEDDPRNPAVIADLVGDNVGDCAGRGADIFESTAAENVGAMILGAALFPVFGIKGILFPLVIQAVNLISSIIGVSVVHSAEDEDPMHALNRGYYVTSFVAFLGFAAAVYCMLQGRWWLLGSGVVGIITSFLFVRITEYYTETRYRPVRSIAEASLTGPATNIISGLAVGMETPAMPVIVISLALLLSYYFGVRGLADHAGITNYARGIYGTAIATMGMLSASAYILAMDTFGPITDNAGGIIEMSNQPDAVREKTDKLDAAGNTTKALTKGYAIGSAALAAFLLFSAYLQSVHDIVAHRFADAGEVLPANWQFTHVNLASVPVFVGALLGAMLTYLFSSMAIKAVGRTAQFVIKDVRAQFKENPGIMEGTSKPDYGRCVRIVTSAALKEMVLPGALAVAMPLAVGLIFRHLSDSFNVRDLNADTLLLHGHPVNLTGAESVAGLLMVGTISGILLAMLMNNGGGAWDNAKKLIETGLYGGKRSEAHKAAVVGDTVGDPFKDTAGPSLHVLIKLLATVTLVLAPLFL
jgi:K(+)-stimulated pyrophosphate-energized sodium pump